MRLLCGDYDIFALGWVQVQLGVCKIFNQKMVDKKFAAIANLNIHMFSFLGTRIGLGDRDRGQCRG